MLSAYNLACGYIQTFEQNKFRVTLWKEHGVYHVRAHEFGEHGRLAWETFHTLTAAREAFSRMKKLNPERKDQ